MSANRDREEEIFDAARELAAHERAAYVAEVCGQDADLRQRIERMIEADAAAGEFFKTRDAPSPTVIVAEASLSPSIEKAGDWIGRYKLLQQIGEGGMGLVYMAEQDQPVRRSVALKIIKLGMDTRQVVARFEAERQALAMMNHPHIAKVFDAGATDSGRPYFVMELVRGIPITEYCDKNCLPTRQRLDLFILVCQAVQHAHQKGVIHRDLKPSNILVTLNDGVPWPMIIDFGIAKATHQRLTEKTLFTHFAQMIGTPAYMSPEQAEMSKLDVDTRTDIYALGVLLYELLTGTTPFPTKELLSLGYREMQRTIAEREPPRLSTRLSTMANEERTVVAKNRSVEVSALAKLFRGDLDWIAMKCLEKDRTRRYETANGLASDLLRHLNNELIAARPPSAAYRFQKAVKRNKLAFAAASAVLLTLIAGLSFSTWAFLREATQRRTAVEQQTKAEAAQASEAEQRSKAEASREHAERRAYASDMAFASATINLESSLGGVDAILSRWKNHTPDFRGWEWHYLNSLCHRERLTILAGTNAVNSVAWHLDGKRLASGGADGTVRIWNAMTGRQIAAFAAHTDEVNEVAWSPDGKRLASASDDTTVKVWDPERGAELVICQGHTDFVNSVAWSPDGQTFLSGSRDKTIRLWNANQGTTIKTWTAQGRGASLTWNTNGSRFASGGAGDSVQIWDLNGAQAGRAYPIGAAGNTFGESASHSVAWSPNDQWLAVGYPGDVAKVLDANSGTVVMEMHDNSADVYRVAWSPNGSHLATGCSGNGEIRIRDSVTGKAFQSFRGHLGRVNALSWSPDSTQAASAGSDGTIKVWDVTEKERIRTVVQRPGQTYSLDWHPEGRYLAQGNTEGSIWVWDTTTMAEPIHLTGNTWIYRVAWNPSGTRLASGNRDGSIKIWDWPDGKEPLSIQAHPAEVRGLAWSPDGARIASLTGMEKGLKIWDARTGALLAMIPGPWGLSLAWSPDGALLAAEGTWSELSVFDANTGSERLHFDAHRESIRHLAWSPDGRQLASASDDNLVKIWDLATAREIQTLVGHGSRVYGVSWSPDGTRLATADWGGGIRIWNPATGGMVCSLSYHRSKMFSIEWNPDGRRIAASNIAGELIIFDATRGYELEQRLGLCEEIGPGQPLLIVCWLLRSSSSAISFHYPVRA